MCAGPTAPAGQLRPGTGLTPAAPPPRFSCLVLTLLGGGRAVLWGPSCSTSLRPTRHYPGNTLPSISPVDSRPTVPLPSQVHRPGQPTASSCMSGAGALAASPLPPWASLGHMSTLLHQQLRERGLSSSAMDCHHPHDCHRTPELEGTSDILSLTGKLRPQRGRFPGVTWARVTPQHRAQSQCCFPVEGGLRGRLPFPLKQEPHWETTEVVLTFVSPHSPPCF